MGDPGLPIMTGALAVPVGVLLFVLVLAMMGRRWALAGPDEALVAEYDAGYEDDDLELEPSHHSAYDPYGSSYAEAAPDRHAYGELARDPNGFASEKTDAERDRYAEPRDPYGTRGSDPYGSPIHESAVREPYSAPAREPYASPRPGSSGVSGWEPYIPAQRRSPERPSRRDYGLAADSYGLDASAADPYGPSPQPPFPPATGGPSGQYGSPPGPQAGPNGPGGYPPQQPRGPYGAGGPYPAGPPTEGPGPAVPPR